MPMGRSLRFEFSAGYQILFLALPRAFQEAEAAKLAKGCSDLTGDERTITVRRPGKPFHSAQLSVWETGHFG